MHHSVVAKHLYAYLNVVKTQNEVLTSLNSMDRFDGKTLENFTQYSQEIGQFISEYQGWVDLLVGAHGLTDESRQLLNEVDHLLKNNLELTTLLLPKIRSYMHDLSKLINNSKPKKHSTPHYPFLKDGHYLNLNI